MKVSGSYHHTLGLSQLFALQATLHASSPGVWLPYSSLDHLRLALQRADTNSSLREVQWNLLIRDTFVHRQLSLIQRLSLNGRFF